VCSSDLSFSADNDWFKALQNAINTPGPEKNAKLDRVIGMATKSGVQTYVIIQTAVAIDENAVGHVLQSATRVTNDPGGVVKSAILANISIPVVIKSVMASSPDKSTIISACIHSGANLKSVIASSVANGADPQLVVSSAITASQNISGVIDASVKAGISPKPIVLATVGSNHKILGQAVSACINSGADVYGVTSAGIGIGSDWCGTLTSAMGASNDYYQIVKAALDMNIGANEIMDCVSMVPSIDKLAVSNAIDTAQQALAYTPARNQRDNRRDSIRNRHRDRRRPVSIY
jgi:hypothetical protein